MEIRNFREEDIKVASELLCKRHKQDRTFFPELNPNFEERSVVEKVIRKCFEEANQVGVTAERDGKVIGYILSNLKEDNLFGRCAWVKYEGLAIHHMEDNELYRKMYEYIAKKWVELGYLKHIVFAPTGDEAIVNTWLHLGFSFEQAYGIKDLNHENKRLEEQDESYQTSFNLDTTIRLADAKDKENLESISGLILSYQAKSPVFAVAPPEMFGEIRKGYGGLIDDDDAHVLMAYSQDKLLGFCCGYFEDADTENMMIVPESFELGVAGTNPMYQSKGVGYMLADRLFQDAKLKGFKYSITDWRITNLKSSIFWPRIGYKPYAYRMTRVIDPRILWADGERKI